MTDPITSTLSRGGIVNLDQLDYSQTSGGQADWNELIKQTQGMEPEGLWKLWYQLTVRGRQEKRAKRSQRVPYQHTNVKDGTQNTIFISFPNEVTSIQAAELTPSRYQAIVARSVAHKIKQHESVSALSAVIGSAGIVKNWKLLAGELDDRIKLQGNREVWLERKAHCEGLFNKCQYVSEWAKLYDRDEVVLKDGSRSRMFSFPEAGNAADARHQAIFRDDAPHLISACPNQVPLGVEFGTGMLEFGYLWALMTDFRNRLRVMTKDSATNDEREKAKTTFASSYARRSAQRGWMVDQKVLEMLYNTFHDTHLEGMNLGGSEIGSEEFWEKFSADAKTKYLIKGATISM
ncbi:nucleoprotein [Wenling red spikefish hantavirus]|uniref:Nucleoprotein n=1 Tax=Wenling red spikefish hantavirus TaxID=2116435 RepID=A0A2P1GNX7_9VIRU|nr:nucleoprotein [Wenling red spikefish hantavirus]